MNKIKIIWNHLKEYPRLSFLVSRLYNLCSNNRMKINKCNELRLSGNFLKNCSILVKGRANSIILEESGFSIIRNTSIKILGDNNTVFIGKSSHINNAEIHIEDNNNKLSLGTNTSIDGKTHFALIEGTSIDIDSDCLFSSNVFFRTGDSHSIIDVCSGMRTNVSKDILIGKHVWFGNDTKILKGVSLGNDVIVATGSIVTKSFTIPNIIVGGNPAKVLKNNCSWDENRLPI